MSHLEELQILDDFTQNLQGDEISKLERENVVVEMELEIFKNHVNSHLEDHKKKKGSRGSRWRGARKFDGKNYGDKVLKKHIKKIDKTKTKSSLSTTSTTSTLSTTIQPRTTNGNILNIQEANDESDVFNISLTHIHNEQDMEQPLTKHPPKPHPKTNSTNHNIKIGTEIETQTQMQEQTQSQTINEAITSVTSDQTKKQCCYHCYKLFVPNLIHTIIRDNKKYFCGEACASKYDESIKVRCGDKDCDRKFLRKDGNYREGQWHCDKHKLW